MFAGLPGASNTISNSSSVRGWLESTGLDDWLCCWMGEGGGGRQAGGRKEVVVAVDGTPLLVQGSPGIGRIFRRGQDSNRYQTFQILFILHWTKVWSISIHHNTLWKES